MNTARRQFIQGPDRTSVRGILSGLGFGVLLVAGALSFTMLVQGKAQSTGYAFFYAAVVAASWYRGKWAGALAVFLSTAAVEYFFLPPVHSFAVRRESLPIFIEFAASSIVIGWFSAWRRHVEVALKRARTELQMRVDERTQELRLANEQLREEIAERRRAEDACFEAQAELARVSRMSALGALAASIAHEVNQPLAAVVSNADACAMWLSSEPFNLEEARAAVEHIAREGTRASEIVQKIRGMFAKAEPEREQVQMNDLISEIESLVHLDASKHQVTVVTKLDDELPPVLVDRVQLQQVIVNLVVNGIEAMSSVIDRPRRLLIRSEATLNNELIVSVRDSGVGIDPKNQRTIFEAFFTTKARGMGMGLSISRSIVEAHGGRLWASANEDYGVTLQFSLPACRLPLPATSQAAMNRSCGSAA